jgi:hypothetical protein
MNGPGIRMVRLEDPAEMIVFSGDRSFIVAGQPTASFSLCVEYAEGEFCQTVESCDIVAVSAPEGGALQPAVMLLDLVRMYHTPLIVLPRDHPGSQRLRYVVSAGTVIRLSCGIQRGTHPEQDILCSGPDLAGMVLEGTKGGVLLKDIPDHLGIRRIRPTLKMNNGKEEW